MRSALVISHSMDFIDNDSFDIAQNRPALFRREQNVKRLGGGDQNMRRAFQHRPAFGCERVTGADSGANLRHQQATLASYLENFAEWNFEVLLNVVAEGFERRNVQNFSAVLEFPGQSLAYQTINAGEK